MCSMEEHRKNRYILVQECVGHILERNWLALGLATMVTPTRIPKGDLMEALPKAEQPKDSSRIALAAIDRKSLRLECGTGDINRLTSEDANLLLAISSAGLRYQTYMDRTLLDFGRRVLPGSQVWVEVKSIRKKLRGTVWYKGHLPPTLGTMFGVELTNPGQGTSDGMFGGKRYFTCPPDSGVFVALDKITPLEDSNMKSPPDIVVKIDQRVVTFVKDVPVRGTVRYVGEEKDSTGYVHTVVGLELDERRGRGTGRRKGKQRFICRGDYAVFVDVETVIPEEDFDENPEGAATKNRHNLDSIVEQLKNEMLASSKSYDQNTTAGVEAQTRVDNPHGLEVGSMVEVQMAEGLPRYGVIRWIGSLPQVKDKLVAGVEMEDEYPTCTNGTFNGVRYFTCPAERGYFALLAYCRQDSRFTLNTPTFDSSFHSGTEALSQTLQKREKGKSTEKEELETSQQLRQTEERKNNMQREFMRIEQELRNCKEHLRHKEAEEVRLHEQLREKESHKENLERQLTRVEERLREKDEEGENLHRLMREMEKEKDEQYENLQGKMREVEEQFREKDEREENLERRMRELEQEKEEQHENLQRQLRELEQQLTEKDEQEENSQRRVRELEQKKDEQYENLQRQSRELERQLSEKDEREENLQRRVRELEQEKEEQLENLQRQLRELEQEKDEQLENLQGQLRELEQEKDEQLENLQRQVREMEQQLRWKVEREENLQRRVRELRQEKEEQQENVQRQLSEMGQQLTNCQGQIREKDGEKANLEQQVTTLERQLRIKDQEVNELELSLSTAQRTISEQRRQETCDWVIPRNEIKITDKRLGKGGWGSVNEGSYCGCSVAVKQIYELILSPHNRRLFEREMNIASRCRHPCLLQFIGATNDEGSPLFVTELMETSLRALLEQRQLCETEIAIISLDVALALNYLHQKKPSPIIHRDVSSANVLLWRQGDQWRGKVSDYGTANFMQQTMTVAPGATIYSAPEAVSSNQTAMIDVYSFGVLLCEMCIRELPDPEKREEQVLLVTNRVMRGLVRRCLQSDPTLRPNMEQIIQDLEQFNQTS